MKKILHGKTALVTGGGRRIGKAISLALADAGAAIAVHYPGSPEETEELKGELDRRSTRSWYLKADFENEEECRTLIGRTLEAAGSLDILINSASIFVPGTLMETGLEDVVRHLQVNSWAPFVLSREFARLAGRGRIVNLLDTRISGYDFNHVAYILSKYLLFQLTSMTALAFAPEITVNGVAPGLILPPPGRDESYLESLSPNLPLKRHGNVEDVADAVLHLVTSNYTTGQVIYVDGGRHLMEYGSGPHPHQ